MKARPVGVKWSLFFIQANERMRMKNGPVLILIFFGPLANGLRRFGCKLKPYLRAGNHPVVHLPRNSDFFRNEAKWRKPAKRMYHFLRGAAEDAAGRSATPRAVANGGASAEDGPAPFYRRNRPRAGGRRRNVS